MLTTTMGDEDGEKRRRMGREENEGEVSFQASRCYAGGRMLTTTMEMKAEKRRKMGRKEDEDEEE